MGVRVGLRLTEGQEGGQKGLQLRRYLSVAKSTDVGAWMVTATDCGDHLEVYLAIAHGCVIDSGDAARAACEESVQGKRAGRIKIRVLHLHLHAIQTGNTPQMIGAIRADRAGSRSLPPRPLLRPRRHRCS